MKWQLRLRRHIRPCRCRNKWRLLSPLTDDDMADMSESAIKAYEEKAKTGILFADRDLASLYDGMTRALGVLGKTAI